MMTYFWPLERVSRLWDLDRWKGWIGHDRRREGGTRIGWGGVWTGSGKSEPGLGWQGRWILSLIQ